MIEHLIGIHEEKPDLFGMLSDVLSELGDYAEASRAYERMEALDGEDLGALTVRTAAAFSSNPSRSTRGSTSCRRAEPGRRWAENRTDHGLLVSVTTDR